MENIFSILYSKENVFSARFEDSENGLALLNVGEQLVENKPADKVLISLPDLEIFSSNVPGSVSKLGKDGILRLAEKEIAMAFPDKTPDDFIIRCDKLSESDSTFLEFIPKDEIAEIHSSLPNTDFPVENIVPISSSLFYSLVYNYPAEADKNIALLDFAGTGKALLLALRRKKPIRERSIKFDSPDEFRSLLKDELIKIVDKPDGFIDAAYLTGKALSDDCFSAAETAFNEFLVPAKFLNPFRLISAKSLPASKMQFCIEHSAEFFPLVGAAFSYFFNSYHPIL